MQANSAMLFTAIIVTYQSEAVITACVSALLLQGIKTIVVDNDSRDTTCELARLAGAQVLSLRENLGFGTACNLGAAQAQSPWLLFINPDAVVQPGAMDQFAKAVSAYPDAGILGPCIVEPNGRQFLPPRSLIARFLTHKKSVKFDPAGDFCTSAVSGACMVVRADLFNRLGGFDPKIFLFFEDDDLCRRVADQSASIIYVHESLVTHLRGQSSAPSLKMVLLMRACQAWSRAYVSRKHGLSYQPLLRLISFSIKLILAIATLNARRIARYSGSIKGTVSAMLHWPSPR
jgi:GT2 family glycosyltransferase